MQNTSKILGTFALSMMAIVAIIDLRGLPMMASYGLSTIFLYGLAALLFLIPTGLVCAELTTRIPRAGGLYTWVRVAFGDRLGFFVIWLEWINNVISFPATLSFMAVYLIYPFFGEQLTHYNSLVFGIILLLLWGNTFFTLFGIKGSSRLADVGALFGTIIPAVIITVLALIWMFQGKPVQLSFHWHNLLPDFHTLNLAFFAAALLGYSGMQVIAFHVSNVKNPQRNYPQAIFLSAIIIVVVTLFATLALALVVAPSELKVISGLVDGFSKFFNAFQVSWATPILILLIVLSVLATFNTWFLGPARGLVVATQAGFFPSYFGYVNRYDIPTRILILQAIIASLLSSIFLFFPDISAGFWILLILSSQATVLMWIFIFAAALKLRYQTKAEVDNNIKIYEIPGGNWGIWLVCSAGIIVCLIALGVSFIPPSLIHLGRIIRYEFMLLIGNAVFLTIPMIIFNLSKRKIVSNK